jgi:hypothetical protein
MRGEIRGVEERVRELLTRGRAVAPLPDVVRARALARARATLMAGPPLVIQDSAFGRARRIRVAVAAALAFVVGAATATAALLSRGGLSQAHAPASTPAQVEPAPEARALGRSPVSPITEADLLPLPRPRRGHRPHASHPSYAAELDLLQGAQAAFAAHDYGQTLALVREHARRFPHGRLAEEREAMRIRSLAASGRADEARQAAGEFSRRFPRSVLLPRLQQVLDAPGNSG